MKNCKLITCLPIEEWINCDYIVKYYTVVKANKLELDCNIRKSKKYNVELKTQVVEWYISYQTIVSKLIKLYH